ncbi:MAG: DUF1801 domain-containing protein [Planctomycetota bacterium]
MDGLFRFSGASRKNIEVEAWLNEQKGGLGAIARCWFQAMSDCGPDVNGVLHDGHPTACVTDAAFAYVDVFKAHVNVGFYRGSELADAGGILLGTGKLMRHVKIRPDDEDITEELSQLIKIAYQDMRSRL